MSETNTVVIPAGLVDDLYGAALAPHEWPTALAAVASFVGGARSRVVTALTFMEGPPPGRGWLLAGVEGAAERTYEFAEAASRHPLFVHAGTLPEGHVGPSEEFAAADDLARTTLAREFFADDGSIRGQSAVLHATLDLLATVHVLWPRDGDGWTDDAALRLRALRPHLKRSVEIYSRLRRAREQSEIDRALLDHLDVAAYVLDASGRLTRMNTLGVSLLAQRDGIERVGDDLRGVSSQADDALRRAVTEARTRGAMAHGSDVVMAARHQGRPLLLFVAALPAGGVAVLARDPERQGPHVEALLERLFELTPMEARVAVRVALGEKPADVAEVLGVAVATVRSHLKKVFDKTATTGQAQVVRLVMGELPPAGAGWE